MNGNQENRFSMMKTVNTVLTNYNAVWSSYAAFSDLVTEFRNRCDVISGLVTLQSQNVAGVTLDKAVIQGKVVQGTLELALKIHAYAVGAGLNDLAKEFDLVRSDVERLRDTEMLNKAVETHDIALVNLVALAPYNVVAGDLTAFKALIDAYEVQIEAPRVRINSKKVARFNIGVRLNENTATLELMDGLMLPYRFSQASFYDAYREARKIIDMGRRKTRLGLFVELEDGVDSTGVVVVITRGVRSYTEVVRSSDHTAFFGSVAVGTYVVTVNHAGYQPYSGTVVIRSGVLNSGSVKLML